MSKIKFATFLIGSCVSVICIKEQNNNNNNNNRTTTTIIIIANIASVIWFASRNFYLVCKQKFVLAKILHISCRTFAMRMLEVNY